MRSPPDGVSAPEAVGRDRLHPPYAAFVSTGAARATHMLEILRHVAGQDDTRLTVATGLRSSVEDRWREAARAAGKHADVEDKPFSDQSTMRVQPADCARQPDQPVQAPRMDAQR